MNLKAQLDAALKRAKELNEIATKGDLTDEQITEATTLAKTIEDLRAKIKAATDAAALISGLAEEDGDAPEDDEDDEPSFGQKAGAPAPRRKGRDTFGHAYTKSEQYKAFRKAHPSGVGEGSPVDIGRVKVGRLEDMNIGRKALTTGTARIQPTRGPMVDMVDRENLTILDLISTGTADGAFEYVQVTGVERNAAVVPEATSATDSAAVKPVSNMTTQLADAKPYTYADGYEVTNQLLADAPAFASYMDAELAYSLDYVIEDKLLNGTGTNGQPRGLLHTAGVQELTYTPGTDAMNQVKAIRQAITKILTLPGGQVTAALMAPEDDEAWDLMQDANDRFFGQGPFGSGPGTAWGRTRALSQRLTPGTVILGDWRQLQLLDVEGLSILAFNQHKDFAQRNMTYVRAELRAMQVLWKPNRLIVVKPATEGGA
ncbi:phage major capsid protein [Nocardiopsis alba]|uniref:phage major capsid protein n=1 Tax=Nocardiopsis alba TaxID=53437 RepID=UPI003671B07B